MPTAKAAATAKGQMTIPVAVAATLSEWEDSLDDEL